MQNKLNATYIAKKYPANFMHFHAGPYAGAATQRTRSSPASPLQTLPFCKKIIRSTALLNHPFARPPSPCPSCWERWNELRHTCWVFAIAKRSAFIVLQGDQVPRMTLEVLRKDSNRDLGRAGDLAHLSINQTTLIILHLSKAKVTLMRQIPLSPFQSSFMPPATRNELTGTLSDLLWWTAHGGQQKDSW